MKNYEFAVALNNGHLCEGTYRVKAKNKQEATDIALMEIADKLYKALPELDIEIEVVLAESLPFTVQFELKRGKW